MCTYQVRMPSVDTSTAKKKVQTKSPKNLKISTPPARSAPEREVLQRKDFIIK